MTAPLAAIQVSFRPRRPLRRAPSRIGDDSDTRPSRRPARRPAGVAATRFSQSRTTLPSCVRSADSPAIRSSSSCRRAVAIRRTSRHGAPPASRWPKTRARSAIVNPASSACWMTLHARQGRGRIAAIAAGVARRAREEPPPLVVAQRIRAHTREAGEHAGAHRGRTGHRGRQRGASGSLVLCSRIWKRRNS